MPASARRLLAFDPTYGVPSEVGAADIAQVGQLSLLGISGVGINANGTLISNVASPVSANDATNKAYVDGIAVGIDAINSVAVVATSNIALTGSQVIDGYTVQPGDRILCAGQTNQTQNGVWVATASGNYVRPTGAGDYTSGRSAAGVFTFIEAGSAWADTGWIQLNRNAKVDQDATAWSQFSGLGEVTAGVGLIKSTTSGNTIAINLATNSGLQFTSGALDHFLSTTGSLGKSASGLSVVVNSNNTLATDANGLRTLGLPALFTVAGTAVDANVTATNLNTLNDGNSSLADALHSHQSVLESLATVATHKTAVALNAGDPVQWSGTADTLTKCDAAQGSSSLCIGVALTAIAANATGKIVKRGIAANVLSQATPGAPVYVAAGGGLTSTLTTSFGGNIVRVGTAKSATDLEVAPVYLGQRAAN